MNFDDLYKAIENNHFLNYLGLEMVVEERGKVSGVINIEKHHKQQLGFAHGGVISAMSDSLAGFAALSEVFETSKVVTAEIKVSYYNPCVTDKLIGKGWVSKSGSKFIFAESQLEEIVDGELKVVAKCSATMAII